MGAAGEDAEAAAEEVRRPESLHQPGKGRELMTEHRSSGPRPRTPSYGVVSTQRHCEEQLGWLAQRSRSGSTRQTDQSPRRSWAHTLGIALLICCLFTACGSPDDPSSTDPTQAPVSSEARPREPTSQSPTGLPQGARRVDRAVILDRTGFGRPLVAATIFVPHGWQTDGGVVWGNDYACTNGYALAWQTQSPSGDAGMAFLPQRGWGWNSSGAANGNCPTATTDSAAAYIDQLLPSLMDSYRVTSRRQRPDLIAESSANAGVQDTGFQRTTVTVDAADVFVEYEQDGRAMRGTVAALVTFTHIRTGGDAYGATVQNWNAFAAPVFLSYGPAESYDPGFYEGLARSLLAEPGWEAQIAQHNATMGRIAREGIMARAAIHADAMAEISEINQRAWDAQQKSSDRRAREFLEYVRDVETYRDPEAPGGTASLSSAYRDAWRLADGSYVLSNDPSFEPYRALGIDGEKLGIAP